MNQNAIILKDIKRKKRKKRGSETDGENIGLNGGSGEKNKK